MFLQGRSKECDINASFRQPFLCFMQGYFCKQKLKRRLRLHLALTCDLYPIDLRLEIAQESKVSE